MSEVSYEEGVFCWVDLSAHDVEAAKRWYSQVFGWEMTPSSDSAMQYSMALQGGKLIAGFGQTSDEMKAQGVPPMWNSYAWVDDCKRVEAAAVEAGGKVIVPTVQIGEFGSMAFLQDPEGAMIGLWQPGLHRGAQLNSEPNSFCWNELYVRDVGRAKDFYGKTLGWTYQALPVGDYEYAILKVGERDNGGIMPMDGPMWEGVPPHWMVYFAVADVDATCKTIEATGGKVCVQPTTISVGRFAVVNDPQGATFSVITLAKPAD